MFYIHTFSLARRDAEIRSMVIDSGTRSGSNGKPIVVDALKQYMQLYYDWCLALDTLLAKRDTFTLREIKAAKTLRIQRLIYSAAFDLRQRGEFMLH